MLCIILVANNESRLELQSENAEIGSKSVWAGVTLKIVRWPRKTMGHPFYAPSSFVHYFVAICEFKLELLSRNAQFGSKLFFFFVSCDLEIWWMTLKNNRAPLLCHFYLCASLVGHRWIETGVTVWKFSIQVKITEFLACVTLTNDLKKQ